MSLAVGTLEVVGQMDSVASGVKFTLTHRQKLVLPVVMIGAFFEGFDFMVINLALPFITRDFQVGPQTASFIISAVAVGALLAFFVVRLADRYGRRPVFLWSVIIYSLLSLATAMSSNVEMFVVFQFLGRIFLVTCWAVGFIIMTEEFAPELRGRAVGLFQSAAAVGAIFPSLLLPVMSMIGLEWRGLYILGALPLLMLIFASKTFPETESFIQAKLNMENTSQAKPSLFAVFAKPYRKHIIAIMGLWFFMYLCYASSMNFFSYHVVNELGWTTNQVGPIMALAYTLGLLGYYVVGKLLDAIGRKKTAYLFFLLGALAVFFVFQAEEHLHVAIAQIIAVFFVGTFTVLCATFTNELFPTEIRANATAWGNNIVGRIGPIAAPALVGVLTAPLGGIGNAVAVMTLGPVVCVLIIALFLPEPLHYQIPAFQGDAASTGPVSS